MKVFVCLMSLVVLLFVSGLINGKPIKGENKGLKFNVVLVPGSISEKPKENKINRVYLKYGKNKKMNKLFIHN